MALINGRDDGRSAQYIYADGLGGVVDLRLSAYDMSSPEESAKAWEKVKTGIYRGLEKLVWTKVDTATQYGAAPSSAWIDIPTTGDYFAAKVRVPDKIHPQGSSLVRGFVTDGVTIAYATNRNPSTGTLSVYDLYLTDDTYMTSLPVTFNGSCYRVITKETNTSVSGNFTQQTLYGDPSNLLQAFPDGWHGDWGGLIS